MKKPDDKTPTVNIQYYEILAGQVFNSFQNIQNIMFFLIKLHVASVWKLKIYCMNIIKKAKTA